MVRSMELAYGKLYNDSGKTAELYLSPMPIPEESLSGVKQTIIDGHLTRPFKVRMGVALIINENILLTRLNECKVDDFNTILEPYGDSIIFGAFATLNTQLFLFDKNINTPFVIIPEADSEKLMFDTFESIQAETFKSITGRTPESADFIVAKEPIGLSKNLKQVSIYSDEYLIEEVKAVVSFSEEENTLDIIIPTSIRVDLSDISVMILDPAKSPPVVFDFFTAKNISSEHLSRRINELTRFL